MNEGLLFITVFIHGKNLTPIAYNVIINHRIHRQIWISCERNVKEINIENYSNIIEAANDNEAKESKHVITAEISIEVTGEDEPTKYDKRCERWAVICFWALLAYIISALFLIFVDINVYFCFAFVISTSVCIFSFFKASYIAPEEPTDPMPWYYGAL